ncbi:hypothetical protein E2I00_001237, partial [Balaenoptera physalus]
MLPVESVPENYSLLSSLHGHRKDTWSQRHWDTLPGSQKPWSLESTVINVSRKPNKQPAIQEVPHVTPVVSVEEGCSPEEATGSDDSRRVTMIEETWALPSTVRPRRPPSDPAVHLQTPPSTFRPRRPPSDPAVTIRPHTLHESQEGRGSISPSASG